MNTEGLLPQGRGTRVLAVANQKGGVGKTTTIAKVAADYAIRKNKKVAFGHSKN